MAQFAPGGMSLKWASYVMSSDLGFRRTDATIDVGVSALAVGPAGDIYIGGLTGPGFPVTPSAPVICFQGSIHRANGFLAHLNSNGALIDATYLGNSVGSDVDSVGGLLPLAGGSVLIAWHEFGGGFLSKVQFGSGGWTAPACLSTDVLNSATLDGSSGIAPGELITLTGFGIGPDIGVIYQPDAQGNVPTQLGGVQVLFDGAPVPSTVRAVAADQCNCACWAGDDWDTAQRYRDLQHSAVRTSVRLCDIWQPWDFPAADRAVGAGRGNQPGRDAQRTNESRGTGLRRGSVGNGLRADESPLPNWRTQRSRRRAAESWHKRAHLLRRSELRRCNSHRCSMRAARQPWCAESCRLIFKYR